MDFPNPHWGLIRFLFFALILINVGIDETDGRFEHDEGSEVFELPDYDATESDLLPIFSNVTCPTDHNAYQHCIAVDFLDGFPNDVLLMNENRYVPIILNGHLQNEPNIQVVFILPDEDNPNNYTIAFASSRLSSCNKFSVDIKSWITTCKKAPQFDEEIAKPHYGHQKVPLAPRMSSKSLDPQGYRLNLMVYYDEAFYQTFGTRSRTRAEVIMALAAEQYLEPTFKTRIEISWNIVRAVGYNWASFSWEANEDFSQNFATLARNVETIRANQSYINVDLAVLLTNSNTMPMLGIVPEIGALCDNSSDKRLSISRYTNDAITAQTVAHEIAHNLGIWHDCLLFHCNYLAEDYLGPRQHNGKDCYGYMDYRFDTTGWSECSTNDFENFFNSQPNFCLERVNSSINQTTEQVCQNNLPTNFVNSTNCPMSCDEWAGKIGNSYDYCNEDWSTRRDCSPKTSGKIKNYCQLSCNSSTCGCRDELPDDYICTETCEDLAGIDGDGRNHCHDDWSTRRNCVPYTSGKIRDHCKLSCNNCEPKETCRDFSLTSNGVVALPEIQEFLGIESLNVTGRYTRMDSLVNNRVSYHNKANNRYLYWFFYGFWMVGPILNGDSPELINFDCSRTSNPASGACNGGWRYLSPGASNTTSLSEWKLDRSVQLTCNVDGGWRSGKWSECRRPNGTQCGNATQTKIKYCDDPSPLNNGRNCTCNVKSSEELSCNGITATIRKACGPDPCSTTEKNFEQWTSTTREATKEPEVVDTITETTFKASSEKEGITEKHETTQMPTTNETSKTLSSKITSEAFASSEKSEFVGYTSKSVETSILPISKETTSAGSALIEKWRLLSILLLLGIQITQWNIFFVSL